jgi:hypothetical protein
MVPRMTRYLLAALALILAVLAGCSEGRSGDVRTVLPINAIAFNDSVGGNDTLYLKVQYTYSSTCEKTAKFEIAAVAGTSDYNVTPVAVYPADQNCTGVNGTDVATLRVTDIGEGPRRFLINGANQTIIANVLGSASPIFVRETGIAFRIKVEDQAGNTIPGALVQIRRLADNFTLADGAADGFGRFEYTEPCAGSDLEYVVSASANGRTTNLIVRVPPARCRIPEAVVIRV